MVLVRPLEALRGVLGHQTNDRGHQKEQLEPRTKNWDLLKVNLEGFSKPGPLDSNLGAPLGKKNIRPGQWADQF